MKCKNMLKKMGGEAHDSSIEKLKKLIGRFGDFQKFL